MCNYIPPACKSSSCVTVSLPNRPTHLLVVRCRISCWLLLQYDDGLCACPLLLCGLRNKHCLRLTMHDSGLRLCHDISTLSPSSRLQHILTVLRGAGQQLHLALRREQDLPGVGLLEDNGCRPLLRGVLDDDGLTGLGFQLCRCGQNHLKNADSYYLFLIGFEGQKVQGLNYFNYSEKL